LFFCYKFPLNRWNGKKGVASGVFCGGFERGVGIEDENEEEEEDEGEDDC